MSVGCGGVSVSYREVSMGSQFGLSVAWGTHGVSVVRPWGVHGVSMERP